MVINPIVGVYIPIIRIPIKGGRSPIPNTMSLDPGTYGFHDFPWQFGGDDWGPDLAGNSAVIGGE